MDEQKAWDMYFVGPLLMDEQKASDMYFCDERQAWDMYFCSICSLRFHPRNDENGSTQVNIEFAAKVADKMMEERRKRKWPG